MGAGREIDARLAVEQVRERYGKGLVGAVVDVFLLGHVLLIAGADGHSSLVGLAQLLVLAGSEHQATRLGLGHLRGALVVGARYLVAGIARRLVQIDAVIAGARGVEQAATGEVVEPARNKLLANLAIVLARLLMAAEPPCAPPSPVAAMATELGSPEEQPNSAPMDATPARLGSGFINQYLLSSPWTSAHPFEAQAFSASPQRCHPRWWPASARRH